MGRPSLFSPEMAAMICDRIAQGRSLRRICLDDSDMPDQSTVNRWLAQHDEFREQYARAREQGIDAMAEETLDIADSLEEDANSRRVRIDARKWFASKLAPKKYGDKIEHEHAGNVTVNVVSFGTGGGTDPPA